MDSHRRIRVGVIGGGTAGYLAALTLRRITSNVDVTLVESSKIPVIGVGEATTSEIVPYLHDILGIDLCDFYRVVKPTWKLGIKFVWGMPGNYYFNYPFDRGPVLESLRYSGHINDSTLCSALMSGDGGLLLAARDKVVSLLSLCPFAYHLDNRRFVQYLKEQAATLGIRHVDREIVAASHDSCRERIEYLVCENGEQLVFDFYVDCTGFRSLLLGDVLRVPFVSYKSSLMTDTAVVGSTPHRGVIKPYTRAETMCCGWVWTIPQVEDDHIGYVFSSAFCTVEQAEAELRARFPDSGDYWSVRFRSGRHTDFIRGNVAAIGNAYGFVEPLESTALFVICREALLLATHLSSVMHTIETRESLNSIVASTWDYIRWFLSIHYRFNRRIDSPFWRACLDSTDISGALPFVEQFRSSAPLAYRQDLQTISGQNFDAFGYDVLLMGQQVNASYDSPRMSEADYSVRRTGLRDLSARAMPQARAIQVLAEEQPELLQDVLCDASWVHCVAKHMRSMAEGACPPLTHPIAYS